MSRSLWDVNIIQVYVTFLLFYFSFAVFYVLVFWVHWYFKLLMHNVVFNEKS